MLLAIDAGNTDIVFGIHNDSIVNRGWNAVKVDDEPVVEKNDKTQFKKEFNATTQWFGEFAKLFLDESSALLKSANEQKLKARKN